MTKIQNLILTCVLQSLACSHAPGVNGAQEKNPINVWIDSDPSVGEPDRDVDDGLALLQSFHSPELHIRAISIVFGNTPLDRSYEIGKDMAAKFGPKGLPVYKGSSSNKELGTETAASMALAQGLRQQKLSILALGPLTTIATVLRLHPELAANVVQIVAVAGRKYGQRFTTGTKNSKVHRDFNFDLDPEAFAVILQSKVKLTLAPFEISSRVWITQADVDRLQLNSESGKWIAKPAQGWLSLWKNVFGVDGFNPFDTLAVAYLTHPALLSCENVTLEIKTLPDDVTEAAMQGTKVVEKPYLLATPSSAESLAKYCYQASPEFKQMLLDRLTR